MDRFPGSGFFYDVTPEKHEQAFCGEVIAVYSAINFKLVISFTD